MRFRFALAFVSVVALDGCAYRTPEINVPTSLHDGREATVHVDVRGVDDARAVQAETERLLAGVGGVVHAHVTIEETNRYALRALSEDGVAVFGLWPVAFGMTYESETVDVDIEIEVGGRTVRGHGQAEKDGSLYASARRRALAAALNSALAHAS